MCMPTHFRSSKSRDLFIRNPTFGQRSNYLKTFGPPLSLRLDQK